MKTTAAILVEQKKSLIIDEIEVPPLSIGQVLVEIKMSRICGSQLGEIDGVKGPDRFLPHHPLFLLPLADQNGRQGRIELWQVQGPHAVEG